MKGISGVYIATKLTAGVPGKRHLRSYITFDKGGDWSLITAPANERRNCSRSGVRFSIFSIIICKDNYEKQSYIY